MQLPRSRADAWLRATGGSGRRLASVSCLALAAVSVPGIALDACPTHASMDVRAGWNDRDVVLETSKQCAVVESVPACASGLQADEAVEEVVVTGGRVEDLSLDERREIYEQLSRGRRFYSQSDYKRAFPLLLNTATYGFKEAQARVGYIYLRGLGEVARNNTAAVGWLGVAASGNSAPAIRNYFNDIWRQIPERHVPHFEEVVEKYEAQYGEQATDVTCELRRPVGSHVKRLACFFDKDLTLEQLKLIDDIVWESTSIQASIEQAIAEAEALQVDEAD